MVIDPKEGFMYDTKFTVTLSEYTGLPLFAELYGIMSNEDILKISTNPE